MRAIATYVLIHGAASDSWYWHLVAPELQARGHEVVAPDLPSGDDDAGFVEYAATVVDAVATSADERPSGSELVVVAQSLGGFTAPLVCEAVDVDLLVLLAAMVPLPGEPPGEWWANTGWEAARGGKPLDPIDDFFHDVPEAVVSAAMAHGETSQSGAVFERPYPLPRVARGTDTGPRLPRRPVLPDRVHAARRARAARHRSRRDGGRPSPRARPPARAGGSPRGIQRRPWRRLRLAWRAGSRSRPARPGWSTGYR